MSPRLPGLSVIPRSAESQDGAKKGDLEIQGKRVEESDAERTHQEEQRPRSRKQ